MIISMVLGLLLLFIMAMLLMPIYININTLSNQYYIQLPGLLKISLVAYEEYAFRIQFKVFGFNFYADPFKKRNTKKSKAIKVSHSKKHKKHFRLNKIIRMMKSFKVKHFFMDIDTGNYILNAKLYSLFALLNYNKTRFYINFEDRNQLIICLKNRPLYILKSFINF